MPTQVFTNDIDQFTVDTPGDFTLVFLDGDDLLTVHGGSETIAAMGEGDDRVWLRSGRATVYGESGNDRFDVWASNASLDGGSGNDLINLRGGANAHAVGGLGIDRFNAYADLSGLLLDGSEGSDDFYGYGHVLAGEIRGGAGDDYFVELRGAGLTVLGGTGDDLFRVEPTNPAIFVENAAEGFDSVQLSRGDSYTLPDNVEKLAVGGFAGSIDAAAILRGNNIDNVIVAHNNVDTLFGFAGDDRLFGKGADDLVWGGSGNDYVDGGPGDDTLNGQAGNDTLQGRAGDDVMSGGEGNDLYYLDSAGDTVIEAAGEGIDRVGVSISTYTLPANVENGFVFGAGGVTLNGNGLDNELVGSPDASDTLVGLGGNDVLKARGPGADFLYGSAGDDRLYAIGASAYLAGGLGNDSYYVDNDVLTIDESSGDGIDTIFIDFLGVFSGVYTLPQFIENGVITGRGGEMHGNGLANSLTGSALNDRLLGEDGDDVIAGGGSDDVLFGNAGFDNVAGGAGSDFITGGLGGDLLRGDSGPDTFNFDFVDDSRNSLGGVDVIQDFEAGGSGFDNPTDIIDLFDIDANALVAGSQAFIPLGTSTGSAGELWLVDLGAGNFIVYADVDGGGADMRIDVHVASGTFTLHDFVY